MTQSVGQRVTVRGTEYQVISRRSTSGLGSRFYGKFSFDLRRVSDGAMFSYFGKSVSANAVLYTADGNYTPVR